MGDIGVTTQEYASAAQVFVLVSPGIKLETA